jgi:hypothetical protein
MSCVSFPAPADVTVLDAKPGSFWIGAWGKVNVIVWLEPAKIDAVTRIDRALGKRWETANERMSAIHVIAPSGGPPEPDARTAVIEMNARYEYAVACGAVVIERGGLMGIAVRSAVTGIIILAPKHYRIKVFDALEPCAPWVAEQHERATSTPMNADDLLAMLRHVRKIAV